MITAGQTAVLRAQLHSDPESVEEPEEPEEGAPVDYGLLSLDTNPTSRVFLGRKSLGRTPLDNIEVPAGEYQVTLVIAGGRRFTKAVRIRAGRSTRHNFDLLPQPEDQGTEERTPPDEPEEEARDEGETPPSVEESDGDGSSADPGAGEESASANPAEIITDEPGE